MVTWLKEKDKSEDNREEDNSENNSKKEIGYFEVSLSSRMRVSVMDPQIE